MRGRGQVRRPGRAGKACSEPSRARRSNRNTLDVIGRNFVARPIIKLRGARVFARAADFDVGNDLGESPPPGVYQRTLRAIQYPGDFRGTCCHEGRSGQGS